MKALWARLGGSFVASLTEAHGRSPFNLSGIGVPQGRIAVDRLHGWDLAGLPRACFVASIFLALGGYGATSVVSTACSGFTSGDAMDTVRNTDFSARFAALSSLGSAWRTMTSPSFRPWVAASF